jgi:tricarballylate dehydrogenase
MVAHLLRDEYRIKRVSKVSANTLEELAGKLEDVDPNRFLREIRAYDDAVRTDHSFNPNIKDARCTRGLAINKTNLPNTIDTPPFEGYAVICGIYLHVWWGADRW